MIRNLNIHSDGYVSERLLYQLTTILLPSLSANITEFHSIDIDLKRDEKVLESKNGVGTALSCGVDSFYTVLKHLDTDMEGFRLTHLTYFNIMNSNFWQGREDSSRDFSNARIEYIKPAVEELGLQLVAVDIILMYSTVILDSLLHLRFDIWEQYLRCRNSLENTIGHPVILFRTLVFQWITYLLLTC